MSADPERESPIGAIDRVGEVGARDRTPESLRVRTGRCVSVSLHGSSQSKKQSDATRPKNEVGSKPRARSDQKLAVPPPSGNPAHAPLGKVWAGKSTSLAGRAASRES